MGDVNLAQQIQANIKAARERRGYSYEALAERCDPKASYQMISRLEKGERGLSPEWIERIAAALEVSPLELITGEMAEGSRMPAILDEQVANELARTLARVALDGAEPEPGTWQALSAMLQELTVTFLANPEVYSDPRVARPVLDFAARRYVRAS